MAESRSTTGEGMLSGRVGRGTPCSLSMRHCTLVAGQKRSPATADWQARDLARTPRPGIRMAGVDFQRPGVVDVEAEYAPRYSPSGAVCDRERRNLLAPVAPRKRRPRLRTGGQPSLLSGLTNGDRVHRQPVTEPVTSTVPTVAQVPAPTNQATPTASASPASQSTRAQDGQASRASAVANPAATSRVASPTGAAARRGQPDRVRYPGRDEGFAVPDAEQVDSNADFQRDSAGRSCHVSCPGPGPREGNACSEQDGQSFRARHN